MLTCVTAGDNHALHAAGAKASGYQYPAYITEHFADIFFCYQLGINPLDMDRGTAGNTAVF